MNPHQVNAPRQRIFLVGCPRSGTTLLQGLIATHPAICSFTESHFLDFGIKRIRRSHYYHVNPEAPDLVTKFLEENDASTRLRNRLRFAMPDLPRIPGLGVGVWVRYFIEVIDALALERGQTIWLEKTPDHLNRVSLIDRFVEDSRVVHILRNGRDVVASLYLAAPSWGHQYSISQCVGFWNLSVRRSLQRVRDKGDLLIHYEELAQEPQQVMDGLFPRLGLHPVAEVVQNYEKVVGKFIAQGETWKASAGEAIRPRSRFEETFDASERKWIGEHLDLTRYQELLRLVDERDTG